MRLEQGKDKDITVKKAGGRTPVGVKIPIGNLRVEGEWDIQVG